jgi:hypothetical protein
MDTITERNQKCEDRIEAHLASRIEDLAELTARINGEDEDDSDEAREELDNFALSLDLKVTMKVQISTGGPGDQFEVEIERGRFGWELADDFATYRFLDWFDGATRRTDNPAVMAYLANMVECISPDWAGE